jgi:hypothetical protein
MGKMIKTVRRNFEGWIKREIGEEIETNGERERSQECPRTPRTRD